MTDKIGPKEQQRRELRIARAERNQVKKLSAAELRQQMAKAKKPNVRPTGRGR